MNKNKLTAIICGAVGACMLTVGAAAGYKTANGYDALKKSILATRELTNCTFNMDTKISFDGKGVMSDQTIWEGDLDNKMLHTKNTSDYNGVSSCDEYYHYNDTMYRLEQEDTDVYVKQNVYTWYYENPWGISEDDAPTVDKVLTFLEIAADTVVGDLRNNFTCTADEDDYTSYRVSLDKVQIPEIINAGLGVIFAIENDTVDYASATDENGNEHEITEDENNVYYYTARMGNDPIVDSVTLDYTLNKDGSFRDASAVVIFKGNGHEMRFDISASIDNVGTTRIQTLEEQGANIMVVEDYWNKYPVEP